MRSSPRRGRDVPRVDPQAVFLNIPYDQRYTSLYLSLISGVCAFGLVPRATIEIPGGERRLDRIFALLRACRYSIHDLSRVTLDRKPPATPRFNMPFELGLAVAWQKSSPRIDHQWIVMEARPRRLEKSLSDLAGTDASVHDGTPEGVFRELCSIFVTARRQQPTVQQTVTIFLNLKKAAPEVKRRSGSRTLFTARVFKDLVVLAGSYAQVIYPTLG